MVRVITKKKLNIVDIVLIAQFSIISILLLWLVREDITLAVILRYLLYVWSFVIWLKGYRLYNFLSELDANVIDYIKSVDVGILADYKDWKHYSKRAWKTSLPVSGILALWLISWYVFDIPPNIKKDVFLLLFFVAIAVKGLSRAAAIVDFLQDILHLNEKMRSITHAQDNQKVSKKQIIKNLEGGLLVGVAYVAAIYCFFDMSILHYVLHYLAVSILCFFTRTLIAIYGYFSNVVRLVFGMELDQLKMKGHTQSMGK
ncbi:MAG: hypothetical protein ABIF87_05015 [Pseudomonadota bacterium]